MPAVISISRRRSSSTWASRASPPPDRALCPAPPPTPPIVPLAWNIPIHAFRCRLDDIAPPRQSRTAAPTPASSAAKVWILDAVKEAPTGLRGRIKGVARAASPARAVPVAREIVPVAREIVGGSCGEEGQVDGLAGCVGAVEFADGSIGRGDGSVGDVCGASGAAGTVVA